MLAGIFGKEKMRKIEDDAQDQGWRAMRKGRQRVGLVTTL